MKLSFAAFMPPPLPPAKRNLCISRVARKIRGLISAPTLKQELHPLLFISIATVVHLGIFNWTNSLSCVYLCAFLG